MPPEIQARDTLIPGCVVCNVMGKAHADTLYAICEHFASSISKFFMVYSAFLGGAESGFQKDEQGPTDSSTPVILERSVIAAAGD